MELSTRSRPVLSASTGARGTRAAEAAIGALTCVGIAAVAARNGGFYPVAWGWMAGLLACVGVLSLLLQAEIRVPSSAIWVASTWVLLIVWAGVSLLWSMDTSLTVLDVERDLVYLTCVVDLLLLCRRHLVVPLLAGVWAAAAGVSLYALVTHLFPDRFGLFVSSLQPGRLYQPLGYWNALGIFAVMGMLVALGLTARRGAAGLRCATAASIPFLACTTYFTFSRGAWVALAIGLGT